MGAVAHGDAVGDGLARVEIEDDTDEVAMFLELELRDIARPDHVRRSRVEIALDEIREPRLLLKEDLLRCAADAFQPHCSHQFANFLLGDGRPILPDDRGDLGRTEDAVVLLEDAFDLLAELPVANGIGAVLAFAAENMVVEGAAINLQGVADGVGAVLVAELRRFCHQLTIICVCRWFDQLEHFAHGAFMISFLDEVLYFL